MDIFNKKSHLKPYALQIELSHDIQDTENWYVVSLKGLFTLSKNQSKCDVVELGSNIMWIVPKDKVLSTFNSTMKQNIKIYLNQSN